jgi:hypothetical protein
MLRISKHICAKGVPPLKPRSASWPPGGAPHLGLKVEKIRIMDSRKAEKDNLSVVSSFRINQSVDDKLRSQLSASGLSRSEWIREAVLKNETQVIARQRKSADAKHVLFLCNKASNNINQLAHRANVAHKAGQLTSLSLQSILLELQALNDFLLGASKNVD